MKSYLKSVVGGCRNNLAEYCSCRCLSQQKEDVVWYWFRPPQTCFITPLSELTSVSSSFCGLTGWSLVWPILISCHCWSSTWWLTASVFMRPYCVISTFSAVECPLWQVTSRPLFRHEFQGVNIMTLSNNIHSNCVPVWVVELSHSCFAIYSSLKVT